MIAYHGQQAIKDTYLARVAEHKAADEITNGIYWEGGKGCAVGCTIHGDSHAAYETELGIPRVLARLEDRLFEALYRFDASRAKDWPTLFLASIAPGTDLSMVWPKFAHWLLVDAEHGTIRLARSERSKEAITNVANLYAEWIDGNKPTKERWRAAAASADYADYADAAASAAAASAADAADYAAASAADAAADDDAARNTHYGIMADKLISLLREAK